MCACCPVVKLKSKYYLDSHLSQYSDQEEKNSISVDHEDKKHKGSNLAYVAMTYYRCSR